MLIAIALLILAVLLFGSSAVLGAIGAVLGFIAFLVGATILGVYFDTSPGVIIAWVLGVPAAVILALGGYHFWTQKR
jgi:hypothetical protein